MQVMMVPLSALEVQAILGLPADCYDALVSAGLLRKSANFAERRSARTSLHTFADLLHLVIWTHLEAWNRILDQEGLCLILNRIEEIRTTGANVNTSADLTHKLLSSGSINAIPEVEDDVQRVTLELDAIWCSLISSIRDELDNETQPIQRSLSRRQADSVKSVLRLNSNAVARDNIHMNQLSGK